MRALTVITLLALTALSFGCTPSAEQSAPKPDPVVEEAQRTLRELEAAQKALEEAKAEAAKYSEAAARDAKKIAEQPDADPASLCWQDYCPCEPGQDGQGMEASLCRNLKAGVHVDDDVMAAAAMMRDARRQLREYNQANPGF